MYPIQRERRERRSTEPGDRHSSRRLSGHTVPRQRQTVGDAVRRETHTVDPVVASRLQSAPTTNPHRLPGDERRARARSRLRHLDGDSGGPQVCERLGRFWTKICAVSFVVGTVTGLVLEFEFGTNVAAFSPFAGEPFGGTLATEGTVALISLFEPFTWRALPSRPSASHRFTSLPGGHGTRAIKSDGSRSEQTERAGETSRIASLSRRSNEPRSRSRLRRGVRGRYSPRRPRSRATRHRG